MNELHHSLESMGVVQYLFAVAFLICYTLAIGNFLGDGTRINLAWFGVLSAFGFAATAEVWVHGVLLLAFAVIGMGLFVGIAWLLKTVFASAIGEAPAAAVYDDAVSVSAAVLADDVAPLPPSAATGPAHDAPSSDVSEPSLGRFLAADGASLDQRAS